MFLSLFLFLRRVLTILGIAPFLFSPSAFAADDALLFNAKTFTLANGLQVVVVENHRAPVVTHMIWYKVGSADEPAGKSGLAHLLEHLMFKGTSKLEEGEFSRIIARNGGSHNAFTSSDYTAYYQTVSADKLPMVMEMEADRMRNLRLNGPSVLTERNVVMEERLTRTENEPMALLAERMDAALWGRHPYGNPVIGWLPELSTLSRENALEFYDHWYKPNNAILLVTGDVAAEQVEKLAKKIYGKVPRGPESTRQRPIDQPLNVATRIELRDKRITQPSWMRYYRTPSLQTAASWDAALALEVLSEILGSSSVSRLYRTLVVDQKLAAAAGSNCDARAVDDALCVVAATPRPGVSIERLETAVKNEIALLLRDGVTEQEVEDAKRRLLAQTVYARDSLTGTANIIGRWMVVGNPLDRLETWPQDVSRITRAQVMAAAREAFREERSVTGILLPETP